MDPRRTLARVAVDAGLGISDGAMLRIQGEHPHRDLMYMVAQEAYDRGARLVRIDYDDVPLTRIRVDRSRDAHVEAVSAMLEKDSEIYVSEGWSLLRIELAWCVLPAATEAWARAVLGPEGTVDEL